MACPRIARWILNGVFVYLLLVLTIFLVVFAINFRHRHKAEGLLRDLGTLRVGQSTAGDVQQIMDRYGGGPNHSSANVCPLADSAQGVSTDNQPINRLAQSVPVLGRVGLRRWGVVATILLQGGTVCYLSYDIVMEDPKGEWTWMIRTTALPAGKIDVPNPEHPGYRVRTQDLRNLRILDSKVTTESSEEERQHTFKFDLSCVTKIRGCRQRCEIAPLIWHDVYLASQKASWTLPVEETSDPRCNRAQSTQ